MNEGEAADDSAGKRSGRVDAVDCARGVAILGMAGYHLTWDLADFRLVSPLLPFTPPMRLLSHMVATVFLALVGVSLALAHRHGFNLPAFCRRLGMVAGAAALVTAGSVVFAPGEGIFFGILHCIAAASLIAAPFVTAPAWASLAAGLAAIAAPFVVHSTLFDPPWLLWLGLGEALPNTLDWYPLLPWAGVVFLGLSLARTPGAIAGLTSPKRRRAKSAMSRAVCFAGRHSLPIYLLHQPILIGLLYALTAWGPLAPKADMSGFLSSCERACVAEGRAASGCATGCHCVADAIERSGDADRLATLSAGRRAELKRLADACMGR
ncbi:MAG TPA: heparan-alpha-glucosaminide N-acetyltransferase [Roseiarcus sp.]